MTAPAATGRAATEDGAAREAGEAEIAALRALVVGDLHDRTAEGLSALDQRLSRIEGLLQDAPDLRSAIAPHLAGALQDARRDSPRPLTSALAPIIVGAIHREIKNSRDTMVDALYPIMARLVGATVANSIRSLTAQINARIDSAVPITRMRLSLRAAIARKSVAEIVMADLRDGEITRILVIDRDSGVVLAAWEAGSAQHTEDPDLVAGMVSAIIQFSESLGEGTGALRTLSFQGRTLHIESSPATLVMFQTHGALADGAEAMLHETGIEICEAVGEEAELEVAEHAARLLKLSAPKPAGKTRSKGAMLTGFVLVAGLVFLVSTQWWTARQESADLRAAAAVAAGDPSLAGLPLDLEIVDGVLRIGAVTRPGTDPTRLGRAFAEAVGDRELALSLTVPADPAALAAARAQIGQLQAQLAEINARLGIAPSSD
ncbi:hypothetical protein N9W17_01530 [Jannaschia sp.]|nr:hypothetical protein [Jannaschia sp.]